MRWVKWKSMASLLADTTNKLLSVKNKMQN